MRIPWFGKPSGGGDPPKQPSGQPVQQLMLRFAEERLRTWLTANMGPGETSRVTSHVIEGSRVCAEALPFRIYIYDLNTPDGQVGFESLLRRSDAPGDVFEHTETTFEGRKLGMFLYRVQPLESGARERERKSLARDFHSDLSELATETTSEPTAREGQKGPETRAEDVAIYLRTSITSKKYDSYEAELKEFCGKVGWRNPKVYHDRAGGTVDEKELEDMAHALGAALSGGDKSKFDAESWGRRFAEMSESDAQHERDNLHRLMSDISRGVVRIVVLHDLSQLGKSKLEAFNVLGALMDKAEVQMPGVGKIHSNTTLPCGSKDDYF